MDLIRAQLIGLFILFFGLADVNSQELVISSGGNASGDAGSVSYTVGQVFYIYHSAASGILGEGVQQPYEIWIETSSEESDGISLQCFVYPNPANDYLNLIIEEFSPGEFIFQLIDMNGKFLEIKQVEGIETKISVSHLVPSVYFLKIIRKSREIITFKIIKN